jgi:two-component system, NtrC family, sensor kinase
VKTIRSDKPKPPSSPDFWNVFDNAPVGIAILTLAGDVLEVNRALCRILGCKKNQFRKRKIDQSLFPKFSDEDRTKIRDLLDGKIQQFEREKQYVHKSGRSVWSLTSVGMDCDQDGEPLHLIMHVQDISKYNNAERMRQPLVHELNERVKELTALHRTARLLQDHERAPGILLQELVDILPAAFDQPDLAAARILLDGVEYRSTHFGSSSWTQSAQFTTASGKHGLVEIAYAESRRGQTRLPFLPEEKSLLDSIAEMLQLYLDRKEAQESVERITRELVERNKELWNLQQEMGRVGQAAALGWMTGAIAHELGTPLNSVLGYTQLLAQEDLPEKPRRHVKTIESQVRRMAGIVQYYLDRTRGSTSRRSQVNLNDLVSETLLLLKPVFAEKSVEVMTQLSESLPLLNAHSGSVQRVLINLLNNAIDSLGQERRITISTYTVQASEQQRSGVNIEISDTGAGISPDRLPKVFDFFMTTKSPANGTGLGLAVCQEIVKEHGGKIAINSQVEKGTTVKIFFPTDPANDRSLANG